MTHEQKAEVDGIEIASSQMWKALWVAYIAGYLSCMAFGMVRHLILGEG